MLPHGLGMRWTTEVEHIDLGQHGDRHLQCRVERRVLRFGASEGGGHRFVLGHVRPVAVEVSEVNGASYAVPIAPAPRPMLRAVAAIALFAVMAWLAPRALARLRHTQQREDIHGTA